MADSLIFTKDPITGVTTPVSTPGTGDAQPGEPGLPVTSQQMVFNGTDWDRLKTVAPVDGLATSTPSVPVAALAMGWGGSGWVALRVSSPSSFFPGGSAGVMSTAQMVGTDGAAKVGVRVASKFSTGKFTVVGSSALWTPAAGKKFRLMRIQVDVTGDAAAAAAADLDIVCYDGATAMPVALSAYIPAAVTGNSWSSGWMDLDNGILSATADNVLNINLSFALTGGVVRVTVAGTEE